MIFLSLAILLFSQEVTFAASITIPAPERNRDPATVLLPDSQPVLGSWPLVLLLHGYTGTGEKINSHFGLGQEVNRRGFVLVLPNGRKSRFGPRYWNATDACCDFENSRTDDVAYLTDLIDEVSLRVPVNPRKIYAAGHSNGAFMVHRLACETSGLFAAMASFAGTTFHNSADCKSDDQLSLLQIHAVNDGTIKFTGDERGFPAMAPYPGSELTVKRRLQKNECLQNPEVRFSLDLIKTIPGADTSEEVWDKCANQTQVVFWKIRAHQSPGHNAHTPSLNEDFRHKLLDFLLDKSRL